MLFSDVYITIIKSLSDITDNNIHGVATKLLERFYCAT
jgi:hypothetical protein